MSDSRAPRENPSGEPPARVWITGARGLLGRALQKELARLGTPFVASGHELDIADARAVRAFVAEEAPTHVFNCAAYARVDDAETREAEAERTNALGPEVLAAAARENDAMLIHFSTDYVFDGRAMTPYAEASSTVPLSAYGRSKLAGERAVLAELDRGLRALVVRTSLLFGEGGDHFVARVARQLAEPKELRVVSDQRSRPTYAPDLARAALELAGLDPVAAAAPLATPHAMSAGLAALKSGLFHFANAGDASRFELALAVRDACVARGLTVAAPRIVPIATAELAQVARRPAYAVLDTTRVERALGHAPRHYREALAEYFTALG